MAVLLAVLWFLAGAAVEFLNTLTRKWTVERLGQQALAGWVVGGYLVRLALTSAVLVLAFRHEAVSGVAALLGYLCSRWTMVWWIHRRYSEGGDQDESPLEGA
jgi:hypothetical protein